MENRSKVFDQQLHDENDSPAREVVKRLYSYIGYQLIDNPNKYGVDLIDNESGLCVEVERRLVWEDGQFPFDTVNFLSRKKKFFEDNKYYFSDYAIVSKSMTRVGIIDKDSLMHFVNTTKVEENPNRYVNEGELFYKIPRSAFTFFDISLELPESVKKTEA